MHPPASQCSASRSAPRPNPFVLPAALAAVLCLGATLFAGSKIHQMLDRDGAMKRQVVSEPGAAPEPVAVATTPTTPSR